MRTFSDQVLQVQDTMTISSDKQRLGRLARAAVRGAYLDIGNRERWNYLLKREQLNTVAPYSTGTIQYTAATRTVVLTGGTFPIWSQSGVMLINHNIYAISIMVDSTTLILQDGRCPVVDLDAGTGFILAQTNYDLPSDFVELRALIEIERLWPIVYLPPEEMLARTQLWFSPSEILFFTVIGGSNGKMQILISPPPASAHTYDFLYQGRPRLLGLPGVYGNGSTLTTTVGSPIVTFAGGSLPTNIAGCVLRIGTAKQLPQGPTNDFPYVEEHVVLEWNSSTQLTLETPATFTNTAVQFTLDDPIDIEPVSMLTYFDRMCETRMFRLHQSSIDRIAFADRAELNAYRLAIQSDARLAPKVLQGLSGYTTLADGFWGVSAGPAVGQ